MQMMEPTDQAVQTAVLTNLQTLYWTGQQLRPQTPIFNTIQTYLINGVLRPNLFRKAFQVLIDSTEVLRTTVAEVDGTPRRLIVEQLTHALELIDFTIQPDPAAAYGDWIERRRKRPLTLHKALFDTALLKLSADSWVWYFNQHHILLDAISSQLIFDKLATIYAAFVHNYPLPRFSDADFSSYVTSEQAYQTSAKFEKAAAFWPKRFKLGPHLVQFFGKLPRKQTAHVRRHTLMLPREQTAKLETLATRKGIYAISDDMSITAVFSALYFTLLHKLSGNQRLGYINPIHNRVTDASQTTIGLLMELCPVQLKITSDDTFLTLIRKVHRETFAIMPYAAYGSHVTLPNGTFDAMFNFHHLPSTQLEGLPVQQHVVHSGAGTESIALHIHHYPSTAAYHLHFDFHEDVFSRSEQAQTLQIFETILDAFLEKQAQTITAVLEPIQLVASQSIEANNEPKPYIAPRSELERMLQQHWQTVLNLDKVGIRDNFFQLGGNSWQAVRLFAQIEEATGQKLPLSLLIRANTIASLAAAINGDASDQEAWSPLVAIQPNGSKPPFFCVHGVFGNVLNFYQLSECLGEDQPFFGLEPRGINGDEQALTTIPKMASLYLKAIRQVQPHGPYYLGGYSLGGEVALEIAHQLTTAGESVALVTLLDTHEPDHIRVKERKLIKPTAASDKMFAEKKAAWLRENRKQADGKKRGKGGEAKGTDNGRLQRLLHKTPKALTHSAQNWVQNKWQKTRQSIQLLNARAFLLRYRWGAVQLRFGKSIPQSITQYYLWGSHITALINYRPKLYVGDVLLFRASQSIPRRIFDPSIRWENIVSGEFTVHHLETVHNDLLDQPFVAEIGKRLSHALAEQQAVHRGLL